MIATITPAVVARAARAARAADDYSDLLVARATITRLQAQLAAQREGTLAADVRAELIRTDAELRATTVRLQHATVRMREYEDEARRARQRAHREAALPTPAERRSHWATDDEWVRHEVYLAWVDRIPAAERAATPIREFTIGESFSESLLRFDGALFAKALRAIVDVVTHRAAHVPSRCPHPLRAGDGACDPQVSRRSDDARCWRVYIEQRTSAARRLHYWTLADGSIELSRVVTHDDMRP